MAWNRKHRRIAELEADNAALTASVHNLTASRDAQCRYAAEKVVDIERLNAEAALLYQVGDMLAKHAPDQLACEWDAAKCGEAWRDERGRFLPKAGRRYIGEGAA